MLNDRETKRIIDKVLSISKAEQTEVSVYGTDSALTRFANNIIHQNVAERNVDVIVRVLDKHRQGVASTNDLSENGLHDIVSRATAIATVLPPSDAVVVLPKPAPVRSASGHVVATAECGPAERAAAAKVACKKAVGKGMIAAGAFSTGTFEIAVANSLGLFVRHSATRAEFLTVITAETSSGYASHISSDIKEIDAEALSDEAIHRAEGSSNPKTIEPGEYEVILEENAVSDLLDFLEYLSFSALAVQESRSFMSGKLGQQVLGENISIWDDGLDPSGLPAPFDFEGVPKQRVDFIVNGVANSPCYDTRTAAVDGKASTGHALPPGSTYGPMPMNVFLKPGNATKEQMVASMKRGLLVSRFWYTRVVHPLTLHVTGMTRDGLFLVENGEVAGGIKNLRFTQSYVDALNKVQMIGRDTKIVREFFAYNRVPALKIGAWNFTGATEY